MRAQRLGHRGHLFPTADEARRLGRQIPGNRIDRLQRRELDTQSVREHLIDRQRFGQIAQPPRTEVDKLEPVDQRDRGRRHQNLAAMTSRHNASRAVQHRTEIVVAARLGLTRRDPHAYRQAKQALRVRRRFNRRMRRPERRAYPVARVLEQPPASRVDRTTQHLVVRSQRSTHRVRV